MSSVEPEDLDERDQSLASLVRTVAAAHPDEPSPSALASLVMERISVGQEREHLAALLPRYVGDVLRRAEQTPFGDPGDAWEKILNDRLPTEHGYQFLRTCTADDVRSGAARRRSMAQNLTNRADLYDAVADLLTDREHALQGPGTPEVGLGTPAPTVMRAGDLPPDIAADLIRNARGYRPPMGRRLGEPGSFNPTIREIMDELTMIPSEVATHQLQSDPVLFEKVALGEARGKAPKSIGDLLDRPDLLDDWFLALRRVSDTLSGRLSVARAEPDLDYQQRKDITQDLRSVMDRQRYVKSKIQERAQAGHAARVERNAGRRANYEASDRHRDLIADHREEFREELTRRLTKAGLPLKPLALPPAEKAWGFAIENGLVEPLSDDVARYLKYGDEAFKELVVDDVTGTHCPELRASALVYRWRATLLAIREEHEARPDPSEQIAKARRGRFHAALMLRLGESRKAVGSMHREVGELIRVSNGGEGRSSVVRETTDWLVDKYGAQAGERPLSEAGTD